jgi:TRAP-type C4-dicarboxylate transport system permease small subunit
MVNPKINYAIEVVMIVCILFMATTSIIMWQKDGSMGNILVTIHHTVGTIFLVLLAIHVITHFKLIIAMTKNIFRRKIQ